MNNNHQMRRGGGEEGKSYCDCHPNQVIIGICPLCLKERLIILASKQTSLKTKNNYSSSSLLHQTTSTTTTHNALIHDKKITSALAVKIFALRSFFHRHLEFRDRKSSNNFIGIDDNDDCLDYTSTSQEDSFISIKFQDNGVASWDKGKKEETLEKIYTNYNNNLNNKEINVKRSISSNNTKTSVVEHVKPHGVLRWRKRIGQILQIMRWRRSSTNKTNVNHVMNKVNGGVKMRKSNWIRTLTKRR